MSSSRGFLWGASSVLRGLRFLARTKGAFRLALVPIVMLGVLAPLNVIVALRVVAPRVLLVLPEPTTGIGGIGVTALRAVVSLAFVLLGVLAATWMTPPLCAPALERIILLRERELGAPERAPASWLIEFWCGLRAQFIGAVVGLPGLFSLWTSTILFPPIAVVTVPMKLFTVSLVVAWGLLDYPLSLRGIRLRERVRLLVTNAPAVIGFGAAITLLFAVPLGAIVLLPAGVAGAAEIAVLLLGERRVA